VLTPRPPRRRPDPPTQHPSVVERLQQVQLGISSLTHSLVQHNSFVSLSQQEVPTSDIDRGVGASTCIGEYNEERENGHNSCPCEPHICSRCGHTCYGPIDLSRHHSFMGEVSILTLSMFLIVIYLFCIFHIYIDILIYFVL
jgi:hypothetical protein